MGHASNESASDFQAWLEANELRAPKDFKFAFTSAHKAAEACSVAPQTASNAWTSISHTEVEVPSSWTLWVKSHHDAKQGCPQNFTMASQLSRYGEVSSIERIEGTRDPLTMPYSAKPLQKISSVSHYRGRSVVAWQ